MANPYLSLLKTAWRYARRDRKKYVLVYAMFALSNATSAVNPILFGWYVGRIQLDSARILHYTWLYAAGVIGLKLIEWCFHGPARIIERNLAFRLSRNFLQERYHQVLHLPVKWHQDHHSGATINRLRKAYEALRSFFDGGFQYVNAIAKFFYSVIAILYFSPLFGVLAIFLGVAMLYVIQQFDRPYIRTLEEVNEAEHVVSSTLFDSLSNIMTVITLRLEKSMERGLMGKVQRIVRPFRKNALINEWKWFTAGMLISLIYALITVGYIYQHHVPGQTFYVGGLVTLLAYVTQFTNVFQDFSWQYTDIMQYNTYVQTASNIDEAYRRQHRADDAPDLPADWREIRIADLDFSYQPVYEQDRTVQSLHDISIRIARGERIALIGPSGSGKSTLLALLRGLYTPEPGFRLTVDGHAAELATINEAVTFFPQEPEIFENTLEYNVTLGLPFPEEEIRRVCRDARFEEVVDTLPAGLQSDIREKGVNLSGGQKQRLALARGILAARDSAVVLLDEPTSSVDPRNEGLIYEQMFRAFSDKAIVSAMHRLHLLPQFDCVYVMEQGRIVASGTFAELRANSEAFRDLWRHQETERER